MRFGANEFSERVAERVLFKILRSDRDFRNYARSLISEGDKEKLMWKLIDRIDCEMSLRQDPKNYLKLENILRDEPKTISEVMQKIENGSINVIYAYKVAESMLSNFESLYRELRR